MHTCVCTQTNTHTHREISGNTWGLHIAVNSHYFAPVLILLQRGPHLLNTCDLGLSGNLAKHQFFVTGILYNYSSTKRMTTFHPYLFQYWIYRKEYDNILIRTLNIREVTHIKVIATLWKSNISLKLLQKRLCLLYLN